MFCHQECLLQWLSHSRKERCELCGHKFNFTPVYAPDAPAVLPPLKILTTCLRRAATEWLPYSGRVALAVALWLVVVPLLTSWLFRVWIHRRRVIFVEDRLTSPATVWGDVVSGLIIAAAIILSFLSLMSFADFLRFHWDVRDPNHALNENLRNRGAAVGGGAAGGGVPGAAGGDMAGAGGLVGGGGGGGHHHGVAGAVAAAVFDLDNGGGFFEGDYQPPPPRQPPQPPQRRQQQQGAFPAQDLQAGRARAEGAGGAAGAAADVDGAALGGDAGTALRGGRIVGREPVAAPGVAADLDDGGGNDGDDLGDDGGGDDDGDDDDGFDDGFDVELHVALDELLGVRGPLVLLLRNLLWLLAFNGAYLGLFAFVPFSIGSSVLVALHRWTTQVSCTRA